MKRQDTRPLRFDLIEAGTLLTETQAAIVQSAIALRLPRISQTSWAARNGLIPAYVSKMLNRHWAVTEKYAEAMNRLVAEMHPVEVPRLLALAA